MRSRLVVKIRRDFIHIDATIHQAAAEISYSYFSIKDHVQILKKCKCVAAALFSMHTNLNANASHRLFSSAEFASEISPAMKGSWNSLAIACQQILEEIDLKLCGGSEKKFQVTPSPPSPPATSEVDLENGIADSEEKLIQNLSDAITQGSVALSDVEKHQPYNFLNVFGSDGSNPGHDTRDAWEKLLQLIFYMLASKEVG
ncbi:hypothetical protein HK100_004140 [Physocladia obscura]|uniref:Uncharacterized protein n=1 Tax=Physocladia obscura TaxID=109957 RepID=A0AAD5ST61_9FUNG|nr:hypothetical protein HK100_004140 [Physocladia obscura]